MYIEDKGTFEGYIYMIRNLVNGRKYIGQTTNSILERWYHHRSTALSKKSSRKQVLYNAMRSYGLDNFTVERLEQIVAKNNHDLKSLLNAREMYYISAYKTKHPDGYNMTDGGDSYTDESSLVGVIKADCFGNVIMRYPTVSDAVRNNDVSSSSLRKALVSRNHFSGGFYWFRTTDENSTITKVSIPHQYGKMDHEITKRNPVCMFLRDRTYVRTFSSAAEAERFFGKVFTRDNAPDCIAQCCRSNKDRLHSFSGNFMWRFEKDCMSEDYNNHISMYIRDDLIDEYILFDSKSPSNSYIQQLSLNDELIAEFCSSQHAEQTLNIRSANILKCCKGQRKTAGGFKWRFTPWVSPSAYFIRKEENKNG